MGRYSVQDKQLKKQYGDPVVFSYGCEPNSNNCWRILVYRITMTNEDNIQHEYSWMQIKERCAELGLECVPELVDPFVFDGDKQKLYKLCYSLSDGPDMLDQNHPREGLVVRVEGMKTPNVFKFKGNSFCELESIRKNDPEYVDLEEIS
jgi:hypothetical protein